MPWKSTTGPSGAWTASPASSRLDPRARTARRARGEMRRLPQAPPARAARLAHRRRQGASPSSTARSAGKVSAQAGNEIDQNHSTWVRFLEGQRTSRGCAQ